ncbi:MAG: hypothetical protein SFV15_26845 [Polyangiaceae bacterium]|nr:hypothetical protein [Polyangiaceae bacterium]
MTLKTSQALQRSSVTLLFSALMGAASGGCASEDSVGQSKPSPLLDVNGTYSVSAVYGENGCKFEGWPTGNTLLNIPVSVQQAGTDLTVDVDSGGIVGGVLSLIHGSNRYVGTLMGSSATVKIFGTLPQASGNCSFTFNNVLASKFSGDFMTGRLSFTPAVTSNPDCATVACESVMSVNGSRPPRL